METDYGWEVYVDDDYYGAFAEFDDAMNMAREIDEQWEANRGNPIDE